MINVIDPERAVIAAGVVIVVGIVIFILRNSKMLGSMLRSRYE